MTESFEHIRTCHLCEAMCGLRLTVEEGRVTKVRPNEDDVWSAGYICPKGTVLGQLHDDPDRLRRPLVRDGDGFREVSWEEAFDEASRRLRGVIDAHGIDALIIGAHSDLSSLARFACHGVDLNDPLGDFRHFESKQLAQEFRVRP